jgi:hypothetical protein
MIMFTGMVSRSIENSPSASVVQPILLPVKLMFTLLNGMKVILSWIFPSTGYFWADKL